MHYFVPAESGAKFAFLLVWSLHGSYQLAVCFQDRIEQSSMWKRWIWVGGPKCGQPTVAKQ